MFRTPHEWSLAEWLKGQSRGLRSGDLRPDMKNLMQQLAPVLEKAQSRRQERWEEKLSELQSWIQEHGNTLPSQYATDKQERSFAKWLRNSNYIMRSGELSPERKMLLQEIAPVPEKAQSRHEQWEENLSEPQSWIRAHGNTLLSRSATDTKEKSLAAWLQDQNRRMKSEELSPARKKMMQPAHPVAAGGIKDVAWCPTGT
eukprot:TRINITY_DN10918_c0_g1_i16.p1 TRINITY_DN10918_c0_g1~~TRINITY_DN10918_c0_g1_i16.p1  ORF type:complete len:201 (-),score=44.22 TRINITY_DN10918_c0_g1_i16:42-644(-)